MLIVGSTSIGGKDFVFQSEKYQEVRQQSEARVNIANQKLKAFTLSQQEHESLKREEHAGAIQRVYIDEFKDVGEGRLYKGQYNKKTGERDGVGVQFWPDGSKYEGMWRRDKANGRGRMTHANGDLYEGEWRDDKANGKGLFIDAANARYEGDWLEDM